MKIKTSHLPRKYKRLLYDLVRDDTMPEEITVDRVTYRRVNGDWRRLSGSNVTHGVTDAVAALLDHMHEREQDEEDES